MKPLNVFVVDDEEIYQFTIGITLKAISNVGKVLTFSLPQSNITYL